MPVWHGRLLCLYLVSLYVLAVYVPFCVGVCLYVRARMYWNVVSLEALAGVETLTFSVGTGSNSSPVVVLAVVQGGKGNRYRGWHQNLHVLSARHQQ